VVAPNADTLYLVGYLDLSGGPLVISVPDSKGRYWVLQFLDAYTNNPLSLSADLSLPYLLRCPV
jgi:hypothetical protein